MPITYTGANGPKEIVPAPIVNISKNYRFDNQGNVMSPEYRFVLNGTILPVASGNFGNVVRTGTVEFDMDNITRQQEALRDLFSTQYGLLEIEPPGGGPNRISTYVQVESLDFEEGTWVHRCDYTINLVSSEILGEEAPSEFLSSKNENWQVTEQDDGTFAISHSISAVGLVTANASGLVDTLTIARNYVRDNSYAISSNQISSTSNGFQLATLLSGLSAPSGNYWNYSMSEGVGPKENSWELTETFIQYSGGNTREEWTAAVQESTENQNGSTVTLTGTIFGHADRSKNLVQRLANASGQFAIVKPLLPTRAAEFRPQGTTINPAAITKSVTYDRPAGAVRYSYTFAATLSNIVSGAIQEDISIIDTGSNDIFAQIPVPGRANGPVVQYMNTVSLPTRAITLNLTMAPALSGIPDVATLQSLYNAKPSTNYIINALKPDAGFYYITQDQETWNPILNKYTRNVSWTLRPEGSGVTGIPSAPRSTGS